MSLIKPFDLQDYPEIPESIHEILVDSGLESAPIKEKEEQDFRIVNARQVFNKAGASLTNAASQVSNIMARGETDSGRLKAAELVLKVHGILAELDTKPVPQITINIHGSENKTLINLVLPVT